ncbi:MAG: tRNA lysidine(34) synthetase TilS [Actinomycetales bacterium]|nr:tRNA lysidine(34) synthetase TilS [Actinomycetales bacterium]
MDVASGRVAQWLRATRPERVVVACSGGGDSLALAHLAAHHASQFGVALSAAVVDHGLQPGSADTAQVARDVCAGFGIDDSVVLPVQVRESGSGPEAAAREARRAALHEFALQRHADQIWLAHTLDDQAETFLIGLTHGSGSRSLAGMAERDGLWVRPVLTVRRHELRACLPAGVTVWEDPHNADPRFLRARVRAEVIPVLAEVLGDRALISLARTAALLARDNETLDALAKPVFDAAIGQDERGLHLAVAALRSQPPAIVTRVVREACLASGVRPRDLTMEHIDLVARLVSDRSVNGPVALPGRVSATRVHDRLVITSAEQ